MGENLIYQFDAYCKRTLRNERIDYYRQKRYRMSYERTGIAFVKTGCFDK